jgi:hypothetical protein
MTGGTIGKARIAGKIKAIKRAKCAQHAKCAKKIPVHRAGYF